MDETDNLDKVEPITGVSVTEPSPANPDGGRNAFPADTGGNLGSDNAKIELEPMPVLFEEDFDRPIEFVIQNEQKKKVETIQVTEFNPYSYWESQTDFLNFLAVFFGIFLLIMLLGVTIG